MILLCWIDMLLRRKTTIIFWFIDGTKKQIIFKTRKDKQNYFKLFDNKIGAYQIIPTNKFLARIWNMF